MEFYHAARKLADAMIARFYDRTAGAFYDTPLPPPEPFRWERCRRAASRCRIHPRRPAIPLPLRPSCASRRSPAAVEYREIAEDTLSTFSGVVEHFGLYAGSYGLALERLMLDPLQIVVVGSGPEAARLEAMAVARYGTNKTVMRVAPFRLVPGGIPEALAEMLLEVPKPQDGEVYTIVCRGRTCLPPITDAEELLKALEDDD